MAKYDIGTYQEVCFCGGSNIQLNLITFKDKFFILSILQSYVLNWYQMYLLHTVMDRMEAIICQHLYCPGIINSARKDVNNCDNFQCTKQSNKKYGKLPAKEVEYIPWNKLYVYLIGPCGIIRKGNK